MAGMTPSELLLLRSKRVDGPRRVSSTLRPLRIAYLVDSVDPRNALAAIEAACLELGGRHQFLIPCIPESQPSEVWERVLDKYDPDWIVDLAGASSSFLKEQRERWDRAVSIWANPLDTMDLTGALVYGALRRWKRLRGSSQEQAVFYFTPLHDHPLGLPLAFRFGHLAPRPMIEGHRLSDSYHSSTHHEFMGVQTLDPKFFPSDNLVELILDYTAPKPFLTVLDSRISQWLTLPNSTVFNVPSREPSYSPYAGTDPESPQHDEAYFRRIAVVGSPSSVHDLCLAWNIRAQRIGEFDSPVWIDPTWLTDPELAKRIERVMTWMRPGLAESNSEPPKVHLVSATISASKLQEVAKSLSLQAAVHDTTGFDRFFTASFRVGLTNESTASFQDGIANIAMPDYRDLADFFPFETAGWTVAVDKYTVPRVSSSCCRRQGLMSRIASDGIAGFTSIYGDPGALQPIGLNNGLEIIEGVACQAGYKAQVSDKGKIAVAVIGLLGDHMGLSLVSSSLVYQMITDMAEIVPRQATQRTLTRLLGHDPSPREVSEVMRALQSEQIGGGQFNRQHRSFAQIRDALGISNEAARKIVEALLSRKVLFRGYEVKCPNCGLRRWYPIDTLSESHRCEGCQTVSSPSPVPAGHLEWRYRLNEIVATAIDQGALPHIIASKRLIEMGAFGFLPGLLLSPSERGGPPPIETDLLSISEGRVMVGECKASGRELSSREVDRFATLGKALNCSRIIYATPTTFEDIALVIQRATEVSAPIHVEVWERADLLDRLYGQGGQQRTPVQCLEDLAAILN